MDPQEQPLRPGTAPTLDDASPAPTIQSNLTQNQLLTWASQQLHDGLPVNHIAKVISIEGTIVPEHFRTALREMIQACDAYRTVIEEIEGTPQQRILPAPPHELEWVDLTGAADAEAEFGRWLTARRGRPLDPARQTYEAALVKLGSDRFKWYSCVHHAVSDATSAHLFHQGVAERYTALTRERAGEPVILPTFAAYCAEERAYLASPQFTRDRTYWENKLAEEWEPICPAPNPGRQPGNRAGRMTLDVGPERSRRLRALAASAPFFTRSPHASLCNIFTTLILASLHRVTSRRRLRLGVPYHNRRTPEQRRTIGLLMQVLPLHVQVDEGETFSSLLRKIGTEARASIAHSRFATGNPARRPAYDVLFNYLPGSFPDFAGIPVHYDSLHNGHCETGLAWALHDYAGTGGLSLVLEYNRGLFTAEQAGLLPTRLLAMADAFLENPRQPLDEVNLLSAAERTCVTESFNRTAAPPPDARTVHELFERRVQTDPDRIAVVHAGAALTYGELNARANRLAHRLRGRDARAASPIALGLERSPALIVGLLGVLKSGAAYLPLDPSQPPERLAALLEDAGALHLVSQRSVASRFSTSRARIILLDDLDGPVTGPGEENPPAAGEPDGLAYVIYTSGSTGRPKGVAIPHRAVVNFVGAVTAAYGLRPDDRVLQFASPTFDASVEEIFSTLCLGATLVLRPDDMADTASGFLAQCGTLNVTVLDLPTAFWHELTATMAAGNLRLPESVRVVIIGGEKALPQMVVQWHGLVGPHVRTFNGYGPTEATVTTTIAELKPTTGDGSAVAGVSIGRPIANTQVYLLDSRLEPVPIGVAGELHIGGAGLAMGYLGRPNLTDERFIRNPFSPDPTARLYRTGDLARWRPDGQIEYLGREDRQVKFRGFRIELGEIENALQQHSGVREAIVQLREEPGQPPRLTAWFVARQSPPPTAEHLRAWVAARLPRYMVPSALVPVGALPRNVQGKIDHRALPAPAAEAGGREFAPPRTPEEETLATIWATVLRIGRVGREDDFFELGGHSLLAMHVLTHVRQAFGVEIPLRELFEAPTLEAFAARLAAVHHSTPAVTAPPLQPAPPGGPRPLSFAQQRLWFLEMLNPGVVAYHVPVALRLRGPLVPPAFERAWHEVIFRHDILRTVIEPGDGEPILRCVACAPPPLPFEDLSGLSPSARESEIQARRQREAAAPFDLAHGPLLRARLLRLGEDEHLFLLTMHHIVSDGWSIDVFVRELAALYPAFAAGQPSPLAPLPVQYADYAVRQRNWMRGAVLEAQAAYWQRHLAGATPVLDLPADHPRPVPQSFRGARVCLALSPELSASARALSRAEGVTMFMTLLAVFQTLLARLSGQRDLLIGTPIAGRIPGGTEPLIGLFVNTLVLRGDLSGDPTFRELLRRVRETCLGAYAHPEMPFEKLVEQLQPRREPGRPPLFQVFFNLLDFRGAQMAWPGTQIESIEMTECGSKFDLTLYVKNPGGAIDLELVYCADLFDAARMSCFLQQYAGLLESLVRQPEARVAAVPLDAGRGPVTLPDPRAPLSRSWDGSVVEHFTRRAAHGPDHVAVTDSADRWTYRELDARSNQLAHWLRRHGVGRESVVAIYAHRGIALVWAMLGTLKAGGALLILDPRHPPARLAAQVQAARPAAWLQLGQAGVLPDELEDAALGCGAHLFLPSAGRAADCLPLARWPDSPPDADIQPDDLAWVVFTSGTTGSPKGILGTHRPLSHFLRWHTTTFGLSASDRFSGLSGLGHDPLLRDIFTPLWLGATLCLPDAATLDSPGDLADWMRREGISVTHLTPARAQSLCEDACVSLPSLRRVFLGGDQLTRSVVARLHGLAPSASCVNFYGTTETPQAIAWHNASAKGGTRHKVPVGVGIDSVQLLVLNAAGHPAGIGEPGEVFVRTPYLARGYLGDAVLTTERFVINPFTNEASDRLYRTGDLARYLPDGTVELAGRADEQVKIRGFRVEPAEVEASLQRHPAVRQAVVTCREGAEGERRLVAYVVCAPGGSVSAPDLRQFLGEALPDAAVPAAFEFLDGLPLTPNGKVDHRALPETVPTDRPPSARVAPRDEVEATLARLWEAVLQRPALGVRDSFFDLGGHSLLAVRLFARVEETFGRRLPLAALFDAPTIEHLATLLRGEKRPVDWAALVPIQPGGSRPPLFCVHQLGGQIICFRDLARRLAPDQPVYGLQSIGLDGREPPLVRVEDIAARYLVEMRSLQPRGPYLIAGSSFGGAVAFELAAQLRAQGETVALLALFDTRAHGFYESLPALESARYKSISYWRRLRFNFARFACGPGRLGYLGEKIRVIRRRSHHSLWQTAQRFFARHQWALPRMFWNVEEANMLASRSYAPKPQAGGLTLFKASEQFIDRPAEPTLGWSRLALGGVDVVEVAGAHTSILREPYVETLAAHLRQRISLALAAQAGR